MWFSDYVVFLNIATQCFFDLEMEEENEKFAAREGTSLKWKSTILSFNLHEVIKSEIWSLFFPKQGVWFNIGRPDKTPTSNFIIFVQVKKTKQTKI